MLNPQQEEQAVLSQNAPTPMSATDAAQEFLQRDTEIPIVQLGQGELIWRRFRRHKLAMIGAVTLIVLCVMAIAAPLISPEGYLDNWNTLAQNYAPRLTFPWKSDWRYIMGSDTNGHALLMWIVYGARVSLAVGVLSAVVTSVIGVVAGATAGYFGGWTDSIIMRITDVFLTIPLLPLLILLSYYLAKGSALVIITIFGLTSWSSIARLVRAYYLTFREQEFTQAARAVGVSDSRIIFRHILPNALSPVIVAATLAVASFIVLEAAVDFLGVGIKTPTTSWGLALSSAEDYFGLGNWWWAFFPGLFILITVLAINFLGDGLRDALDVRAHGE